MIRLTPAGYGLFIITRAGVTVRVTRAGKTQDHKFGSISEALRFCDENVITTCRVDEVLTED